MSTIRPPTHAEAMETWAQNGVSYTNKHLVILGYKPPGRYPVPHQQKCQIMLDIFAKAPGFKVHKWATKNGEYGQTWSNQLHGLAATLGKQDLLVIYFNGPAYTNEYGSWTL